jgi:nicotinamide-nucleotide amidase
MAELRAEIISIGDEITSGVRLDTNSQWISQRLGELGVRVAFHTTVGDDLADNVEALRQASQRADIVVTTGGLGPTADDLTREAISEMADVELVMHQSVLDRIKQMYESRGREMPSNNEVQAWFPRGAEIINNPEGTAPGIDFRGQSCRGSNYRIFALPGVPVEMKQMWSATVDPALRKHTGNNFVFHHHTIHCFGSGESHVETLLPDLIKRGRDPQVGITASSATISLRISTRGKARADCIEKMRPTILMIQECLGDLVYGENGQELHGIIVQILSKQNNTVSVFDAGLNGAVASLIAGHDVDKNVFAGGVVTNRDLNDVKQAALDVAEQRQSSFGIAIGPINRNASDVEAGKSFYSVAIADGHELHDKQFRFSGHSGWREDRAAKEVLNFFRLHLLKTS